MSCSLHFEKIKFLVKKGGGNYAHSMKAGIITLLDGVSQLLLLLPSRRSCCRCLVSIFGLRGVPPPAAFRRASRCPRASPRAQPCAAPKPPPHRSGLAASNSTLGAPASLSGRAAITHAGIRFLE